MNDDNSFDLTGDAPAVQSGVRLGLRIAADFLANYDHLSSHKYKLGDALLAKFGIIDKAEMRLNRNCGMEQVFTIVARELNTTTAAILSRSRIGPVSRARHLCCYLGRKVLWVGPNEIARALGVDHTSVLYGHRQGRKLHISMGKTWKQRVDKIIAEIEG